MARPVLAGAAVLLVLVPAAVCYRSGRAATAFDAAAVEDRLGRVPMRFGDWAAGAPDEEDASAFHDERYPGLMRRYVNPVVGRQVLLLVRGGPAGPLVYHHQPQQCYAAVGFAPHGRPTRREPAGAQFLAADFVKPGPSPESVRIYWAWSGDGVWAAPDEPRFRFTGYPLLYRAYVVRRTGSPSDPHDGDGCEEFLRAALPDLTRALFGK